MAMARHGAWHGTSLMSLWTDGWWREGHDDDDGLLEPAMRRICFGVFLVDAPIIGLSGLKLKGFQDTLRRARHPLPRSRNEECCAHTPIDPEEGNITHGLDATPRAWTFRWYRSSLDSRVCGKGSCC
jgi:hypothetical protein